MRRPGRYSWKLFAGDIGGGLIASLIALPYGLAMAALMGLPPTLGLFTSILTAPVIALLGRNPVMIGGTASATVPFLADAVSRQGIGGAAKLSIIAGVAMMCFSLLRWGRHVQKIPLPVVSGFSCGIGALMIILQLDTMLGLSKEAGSNVVLLKMFESLGRISEGRWVPFVLAMSVVIVSQLLFHYSKKIPAPLVAVIVAVSLSQFFGWHEQEVGKLTLAMPEFAGFNWAPREVASMLANGLGLAFVVSANVLMTSRVVEHYRGRHLAMKQADADGELGAYGIANVFAGIFGAPVSVGIPARSVANVRCGGTTRWSNIYHAGFLALMLALGSDWVARIPVAALAGVTAWMGWCLLDWGTWRRLPKMRRSDAAAFLVTAGCVLLMNAVAAVALGCLVYASRWLYYRYLAPIGAAHTPTEA